MAKIAPIQNSFNGGELSPYIAGRPDVSKFTSGCDVQENFIPMVEGPAIARPGTVLVAEVKESSKRTWLVRFEFSAADSYILEFGDLYIRFYYGRGQVMSGATPYEIVSPYASADLTDSKGAFALRMAQTGDVVRIVGGGKPMHKLTRLGATSWTIAPAVLTYPPFAAQNITATTMQASGTTGSITITASAATFTTAHVGQQILLREADVRDIKRWEVGKAVLAGALRRNNGYNYIALNAGTTGTVQPTHSSGAEYDGDAGVQWQYEDSGEGYATITAFTSDTEVDATVVSQLPGGAVTTATTRWAFQAWNATDGYPTSITFFRERLTLARDSTVWFSVAGDFDNFATRIDGLVVADAGFERTLSSDRVNDIRWMSSGDVLLIGTIGDEWALTEATTSDPFGPDNCKTKRQSTYGSNTVAPQRVGSETLFVQRAGTKIRAMASRFEEGGFESPNVGAFARTITLGGVVQMAYQQEPWSVVWMVRADGLMVGLTLDREQDVVAWHRHPFDGGVVESMSCIPSPNGGQDDLWLIVRYTVEGVTRRYVAYMADADDENTDPVDWLYSDMALTYSGTPTTTISGLDVHEGKTVWVLADGGEHPERVVSGGEIELQDAASVVHVGLPCLGRLLTTNMEVGGPGGTSQGKIKRTHLTTIRLYRSLGGLAGPSFAKARKIQGRSASVNLGDAPPPFTGDVDVEWDDDYSTGMRVAVVKDKPMPMTLIAVMPQSHVEPGR